MIKKLFLALMTSLAFASILIAQSAPVNASKTYVLHFQYTSQLYPLYAPNACEAASLKMALSAKKSARHPTLKTIIRRMPRSRNPNQGFTGNPYRESPFGVVWTIFPQPLAKYARQYDPQATNISGANKNQLINEIKHRNPVIFAGAWRMQLGRPYHVLTLVGYRHGYFKVADPYMKKSWPNKVYWTRTTQFMKIYQSRHQRAVVIR